MNYSSINTRRADTVDLGCAEVSGECRAVTQVILKLFPISNKKLGVLEKFLLHVQNSKPTPLVSLIWGAESPQQYVNRMVSIRKVIS